MRGIREGLENVRAQDVALTYTCTKGYKYTSGRILGINLNISGYEG